MSNATLKIDGYVAQEPKEGRTQSGDAYLSFSVPHTPRKKNRDTGEWEDAGDTLWVQVTLWREDAERFAGHIAKGTQVRVEGEPFLKAWESNGKSGVNLEVKFPRASIVPEKTVQSNRDSAPATAPAASWETSPASGYTDETPF